MDQVPLLRIVTPADAPQSNTNVECSQMRGYKTGKFKELWKSDYKVFNIIRFRVNWHAKQEGHHREHKNPED